MDCVKVYPGILRGSVEYFFKKYRLQLVAKLPTGDSIFECTAMNSSGFECCYKLICRNASNSAPQFDDGIRQHFHQLNEAEYISALYRAKMFDAAEENLKVNYAQLHTEVLQSMMMTDEQMKHVGSFNWSFMYALDARRHEANVRGHAVHWCDSYLQERSVPQFGGASQEKSELPVVEINDDTDEDDIEIDDVSHEDHWGVPVVTPYEDGSDNVSEPVPSPNKIVVHTDEISGAVRRVRVLGRIAQSLPSTPTNCHICFVHSASVAVVGCGCVCICGGCSDSELSLKACPKCKGGMFTGNGRLLLQRLH